MLARYDDPEPTRAEIDAYRGPLILEFGAPWCPHCIQGQQLVAEVLASHRLPRLCIEDGPGRPLGRSYGVKLWPTIILLKNGQELSRIVRPRDAATLSNAMISLDEP